MDVRAACPAFQQGCQGDLSRIAFAGLHELASFVRQTGFHQANFRGRREGKCYHESEIGSREHLLGSFKSADGFCAWLGLCPCNSISGGKVLRSATRKVKNRLSEALRMAAFDLERSKTKLGEYCRRMKGRLGKAEGIVATAHKLARILYTLIANRTPYDESQAFPMKPATHQKQFHQLQTLAKKLGLQVLPNPVITAS